MSDRHNDKDDWSSDSASLIRAARRAHDPTPLERARLDAVFARIQAGTTAVSPEASAARISARGVAPAMLRQVAKVSLAVVCVAGVSLGVMKANRQPSTPAPSARPAPSSVASSPVPIAMPPAPVPSAERREFPHDARGEVESHSRSQRRRTRADAAKQRASRLAVPSVVEASVSAAGDGSTGANAPPIGAPEYDRSEPDTAVNPVTSSGAAPQASSLESKPQAEMIPAARKVVAQPSQEARSEIALLKRMQAALRRADFSTALALCAEHEQRWPHGNFALEREGVRAIASCGANSDDASQRARSFLAAHPHAPVAMRVSSACAAQLPKR